MEEKQLFGAVTVYRERGAFLRRLEQYDKAQLSYNEANRNNPEDVRTLVGRSQVCIDNIKTDQAYDDAIAAIYFEPRNLNAQNMKARALFGMLDFENSLITNYRGYRCRRQPRYFKEGINQGRETIQDCIGKNAGSVLLDFYPLIKHLEHNRCCDKQSSEISLHESRIPKPECINKLTQMQLRNQELLSRVLAMKYLGPMAYDKFFLQSLMSDSRISSANSKGSQELKELIQGTLKTLNQRQEALRAQRPYYNIKLSEKSSSKYQTKFKALVLKKERISGAQTIIQMLKKIELCSRESRMKDLVTQAECTQAFLNQKTPRTLPDKNMYIDRLYKAVGEGYLAQYQLSYTLSELSNRRRVAFLMGLPITRPTSYDPVLANYPHVFTDPKTGISKLKHDLDMCENMTMRCWLLYEISRRYITQKNYALAKFYGKLCQKTADELGSQTWWMNGCFALMSSDMRQGNANEVVILVEEANERSKDLQNPEKFQAFLDMCKTVFNEIETSESKALRERERQIESILDQDQRAEYRVLLRRIAMVPEGRRFRLLPSKENKTDGVPERRSRLQKRLTIIPGPARALQKPPRSSVLGLQMFEK